MYCELVSRPTLLGFYPLVICARCQFIFVDAGATTVIRPRLSDNEQHSVASSHECGPLSYTYASRLDATLPARGKQLLGPNPSTQLGERPTRLCTSPLPFQVLLVLFRRFVVIDSRLHNLMRRDTGLPPAQHSLASLSGCSTHTFLDQPRPLILNLTTISAERSS